MLARFSRDSEVYCIFFSSRSTFRYYSGEARRGTFCDSLEEAIRAKWNNHRLQGNLRCSDTNCAFYRIIADNK